MIEAILAEISKMVSESSQEINFDLIAREIAEKIRDLLPASTIPNEKLEEFVDNACFGFRAYF